MPSSLTLQRSLKDDVAVISIDGFLDAHTAPQFEQALQQEIADGRVKLVVDCAKLTYISSAGLGVFMGFIEEVREQRGDIKVCGLTLSAGVRYPRLRHHLRAVREPAERGRSVRRR